MVPTIKSKQRVAEHGEVLTPQHIVDAMLDLVKPETERIDSRFLEPACGTGNFLVELLRRKLRVVEKRYARSQMDWERYAVLVVSSLYGIDILEDNAQECRQRLFQIFDELYSSRFRKRARPGCRDAVRYLLKRNIVEGDALTLKTVGKCPEPIVFCEWSLVNGYLMKRRDFAFEELLRGQEEKHSLFDTDQVLLSDKGKKVFIPKPVRDYPPVHFLEIAHAYGD
ncbi:MAG: DNA methyltransferase [Armatimonadota bacterium]